MLAEQASNTDIRLPQELRAAAHVLSGELAWAGPDALRVVDWLSAHGSAVVGVERWRDENGAASWLETSNYSPRPGDTIDSREIARCAAEAEKFISEVGHSPDDLFNLSWMPPVPDETLTSLAA